MPPAADPTERIRAYLARSAEVKRLTATSCAESIARGAELLVRCYREGGKVLFCGNGGSAADCQHLAAELVNGWTRARPRPALAAVALTTDSSFLTANANDVGFEHVFERQVEALGRPGDVLVAISTSGGSANVLRALTAARAKGLGTILLSGASGGAAASLADVAVLVPSTETQHIQEAHIAVGHLLCALVEEGVCPWSS